MKIVDRETFMTMPAGTVFSKYSQCAFGDLFIKGETLKSFVGDFYYQQIADSISSSGSDDFFNKCFDATHNGTPLQMDFHCESRDGLFDLMQLFAVWERPDIEALIARLQEAITACH